MQTTLQQRAVLYAVYLLLKKMFDKHPDEIPAGTNVDVSGQTVVLTIPNGAFVKREMGENGDGTINKAATQNLYGFAMWAIIIKQLKLFKQWEAIWRVIQKAFTEQAVKSQGEVGKKIQEACPELDQLMKELRDKITVERKEPTSRRLLLKDESLGLQAVFNAEFKKVA